MSSEPGARERVAELLERATELPEAERRAFIERSTVGESTLRDEALSLLAALARGGRLLEPERIARRGGEPIGDPSLTGFRFGAYVVGERVGAGGMGVVYRARDSRLGRDIAVKALPAELARDPERRARLEQEARALAILNHPNIAAIYGAEDTERGALLVLEYVPGSTLAQIIARGPLPIEDVIAYARQIALALEEAHALGVVHRDLKPTNLRITDEGAVKVLDFGIAEVLAPTPPPGAGKSESGSSSASGSVPRITGTAAYMSPEQARGKRTDRRTDLWAFGCVLFEMLTGERAFGGEIASDAVTAVLHSEPSWERLPSNVPPSLRRLLERCLRKDLDQRLRDAADARIELDDALRELSAPHVRPTRQGRWSAASMVVVAILSGAIGIMIGEGRSGGEPKPSRLVVHNDVSLPLDWDRGLSFSVHADPAGVAGELLAFTGGRPAEAQALYLQRSDELEPTRVDVVGRTPRTPAFSPDGEWIAYSEVESGRLMRYGVRSGTVEEFGVAKPRATGIAWADDDTLLFTSDAGLTEIDLGGAMRTLLAFDAARGDVDFGHPCVLEGGEIVLMTRRHRDGDVERRSIEAVRRLTGERWTVRTDAWAPMAMDRATLLWCEASGLLAAAFSTERASIEGEPVRVMEGLGGGDELFPVARATLSANGTLVSLPNVGGIEPTQLAWLRRDGSVDRILSGSRPIHAPRLSPSGDRIAFTIDDGVRSVWIHDLARGTTSRVGPADGRHRDYALWCPDGRSIAVTSSDESTQRIERIAIDQSEPPKLLIERPLRIEPTPNALSPDGRSILITLVYDGRHRDLFLLPIDGGAPIAAFPSGAPRTGGRFSPDGSAILYLDESGPSPTVVAESWPDLRRRAQVSERSGVRAEWRPDGRSIFYRDGRDLWEVDIATLPELAVGPRRIVFEAFPEVRYAVANDGVRILCPIGSGERRSGTTFALHRRFDLVVRAALAKAAAG